MQAITPPITPMVIAIGELDPELDRELVTINEKTVLGQRQMRAVLTTDKKEAGFLSSPYDPTGLAEKSAAMHALLVAVCDAVMDETFPRPDESPEQSSIITLPDVA